jgi:hypothetical protein
VAYLGGCRIGHDLAALVCGGVLPWRGRELAGSNLLTTAIERTALSLGSTRRMTLRQERAALSGRPLLLCSLAWGYRRHSIGGTGVTSTAVSEVSFAPRLGGPSAPLPKQRSVSSSAHRCR